MKTKIKIWRRRKRKEKIYLQTDYLLSTMKDRIFRFHVFNLLVVYMLIHVSYGHNIHIKKSRDYNWSVITKAAWCCLRLPDIASTLYVISSKGFNENCYWSFKLLINYPFYLIVYLRMWQDSFTTLISHPSCPSVS